MAHCEVKRIALARRRNDCVGDWDVGTFVVIQSCVVGFLSPVSRYTGLDLYYCLTPGRQLGRWWLCCIG